MVNISRLLTTYLISILMGSLFGLPVACAQKTATPIATIADKDPKAVSVLTSLEQASGGASMVEGILDITAQGVFTHYWANQEVKGDATILGLGTDHFQLIETLPDGERSWTMKGVIGTTKNLDGKVATLALHEILSADTLMYFLPRIVFAIKDPLTTISYVGLESMQEAQVHHLRIQTVLPSVEGIDKELANVTAKELFVDAKTSLLVKIEDQAQRSRTSRDPLPHSLSYSNYQDIQGILMPFAIDETIDGIPVSHFETTNLSINTGLTDSSFVLAQ
jgi:hypothetical protein